MKASRGGAGATLSATTLTLSSPGATRPAVSRVTLAPPADNGAWPALAAALRDAGAADTGGGRISVALQAPLIDTRRLFFPARMPLDQVAALITRSPGKYFVGARGPQTIGVMEGQGPQHEGQRPVIATAVAARLVSGIHAAARDAGCTVESITPAESAWAAAGVALWPASGRRTAHLLVHEDSRITLVELHGGEVANVRRFRPGAADAELIAAAVHDALPDGALPSVGAFGMAVGQQELMRALSPRGVTVAAAPGEWADLAEAPDVMAATFAADSAGPLVLSDAARARRALTLRNVMYGVAAAAVVLCFGAAGIMLWGAQREFDLLTREREALAPQVMETVMGRNTVEEVYLKVAALRQAERLAPHWSPIIAELTRRVPNDAYFTAFHTKGDSLWVDGVAGRAAHVFDALDQSRVLTGVRSPNPVRLQSDDEGGSLERFTINAVRRDSTRSAADSAALAPAKPGATRAPAAGKVGR